MAKPKTKTNKGVKPKRSAQRNATLRALRSTTTNSGFATPRVFSKTVPKTIQNTSGHAQHVRHSVSITNPFHIAAKGSKRPDGLGTQTLPYQTRTLASVTTDASGRARLFCVPGYGIYDRAGATGPVASNWTVGPTFSTAVGGAFVGTNAFEVRVVSYGVRVISVASSTNCSGFVIFGTMPNVAVGSTINEGNTLYPEHSVRPITSGFETSFVSKPAGTAAHSFRPTTLITSTMSDFDWTCFSIEVVGGAVSTTVLVAEIITNVEIVLNQAAVAGGSLTQLIPPSVPHNPVALSVQNVLHSALPSTFDGPVAAFSKMVEDKASSVVSNLFTGALSFLGL